MGKEKGGGGGCCGEVERVSPPSDFLFAPVSYGLSIDRLIDHTIHQDQTTQLLFSRTNYRSAKHSETMQEGDKKEEENPTKKSWAPTAAAQMISQSPDVLVEPRYTNTQFLLHIMSDVNTRVLIRPKKRCSRERKWVSGNMTSHSITAKFSPGVSNARESETSWHSRRSERKAKKNQKKKTKKKPQEYS